MSESETEIPTQHAMLVIWGQFAQALGMIQAISDIPLDQKTVDYSPHTKVLEFFLAILGGLEHLQELNTAAEPIVKDEAVAKAWGQPGWAHHSGVSRTLSQLTQAQAEQIIEAVERLERPFIDREVMLALASQGELILDGDLTARPVSDTSTDYPDAAFGHMDANKVGLGYQSAQVSLQTPTYGRLLLSSQLHPGDVVSNAQTQALVQAAEARLGMRPLRRTALLAQRLEAQVKYRQGRERRLVESQQAVQQVLEQMAETERQIEQHPAQLAHWEVQYLAQGRKERPFSHLGKLRRQLGVLQRRLTRLGKRLPKLERQRKLRAAQWTAEVQVEQHLRQRLEQFEQENEANAFPIRAIFRLDAGFSSRENVAWLIEMGYEVYTRPYGSWLLTRLKKLAGEQAWLRVGSNAEIITWQQMQLTDFPYPLDLALQRFHAGEKLKHTILLHFGTDTVTADPAGWFTFYNARQTIEAGIKQGKSTFAMRYLKIRSKPALYLQEQFGRFAANFVRLAATWVAEQCPQIPIGWEGPSGSKIKQQVKVGAHTSAWVSWQEQGCLVRFTDHSVFAGRSFLVSKPVVIQLALPFAQKVHT